MALHVWAVADAAAAKAGGTARPDATGYAAGLLGSLIAGSVFVAVKGVEGEMPPWTLCCTRSLISAAILMPLVARPPPGDDRLRSQAVEGDRRWSAPSASGWRRA